MRVLLTVDPSHLVSILIASFLLPSCLRASLVAFIFTYVAFLVFFAVAYACFQRNTLDGYVTCYVVEAVVQNNTEAGNWSEGEGFSFVACLPTPLYWVKTRTMEMDSEGWCSCVQACRLTYCTKQRG